MMSKHAVLPIVLLFCLGAVPAIAKKAKKPAAVTETVNYDGGISSLAPGVWRFSLDGKYYSVELSGGLRIAPVRSGQLAADVPRKTDKKGRTSLEGQWRAGSYTGLLIIHNVGTTSVSGQMLVPAAGAGPAVCSTRKSAFLFSLGQPQPVCNTVNVSWILQPDLSKAALAGAETAQDLLAVYSAASRPANTSGGAPPSSVDSSLVGVWSNQSATAVYYESTHLVLNADGTYRKTFGARPPTMGGGVVGAPTWGDTHTGSWSVVGPMRVRLSGDSQHTPYTQDLRQLSRH